MTASRRCEAKVVLRDSETHEVFAGFETLKEAMKYAVDNDIKCYIAVIDYIKPN